MTDISQPDEQRRKNKDDETSFRIYYFFLWVGELSLLLGDWEGWPKKWLPLQQQQSVYVFTQPRDSLITCNTDEEKKKKRNDHNYWKNKFIILHVLGLLPLHPLLLPHQEYQIPILKKRKKSTKKIIHKQRYGKRGEEEKKKKKKKNTLKLTLLQKTCWNTAN